MLLLCGMDYQGYCASFESSCKLLERENSIISVPARSCAIDNCVNQVFQLRLQQIPEPSQSSITNMTAFYELLSSPRSENRFSLSVITIVVNSAVPSTVTGCEARLCLVYLACTHMDGGTLLWWLYLTASYRREDQQPRFVWKGKNAGSKHNRRECVKSRDGKWCQSVKFTISIRLWVLQKTWERLRHDEVGLLSWSGV